MRDPVNMLAELGRESAGGIVRLPVGTPSIYLVSHPDDVQHVLRGNWENYQRQGMFWRPLQRLLGASVLDDGAAWQSSREILQPLFTARYVASLAEQMAAAVDERIAELEPYAASGRSFDAGEELADVVNQTVIKVLFAGRLSREGGRRLSPAYDRAARSIAFRLLLPSMPYSVRLPGDRAFMDAVQRIDDVVLPMIRQDRDRRRSGTDVFSTLVRAREEQGAGERQVRDDVVSVYGAAAESTATTLTWLWATLAAHPEVASGLYEEVGRVVGDGPVRASHLPELGYTKMVLQELMRLRPAGWLFPRMAKRADLVGGVQIEAGAQVLITPYATHRLDEFWERPLEFDPERFAPGRQERRHRYAYFPFGGGPHQCLGRHLFDMAAPLIVAALLSRFRPVVRGGGPFTPAAAGSLRPKERVELALVRAPHLLRGAL
ncbi:cytochrome P450 [Sphaerisporangium rhizosphaerae]|uniref:Cytochrome P450 n=1 Tax=Sphaerisporangium rhizosphaerae TaxID=2269375 RepID=A0ABW2P2L1_9ACTN